MSVPERLELLALYVIARAESPKLGATRLNKVLWFADLEHYRRHGRSLTGLEEYTRMPNGPVPPGIDPALAHLKAEGKVVEIKRRVFSFEMRELIALVEPNLDALTAEQVDLVSRVIEDVCSRTAEEVSSATHDALWSELSNGDVIPIGPASIVKRTLGKKQLDWAMARDGV